MKIRKGFVSNSSTTTFICSICREIEAGRDSGLSDFEMFSCINDHEMHEECLAINDDDEDSYYTKFQEVPIEFCPICQLKEITEEDMFKFLIVSSKKTKEEIKEWIQSKFDSYEKFMIFLKGDEK